MHVTSSATTTRASQRDDSREYTGEVICEADRKRKLEGRIRSRLVYALSTLLVIAAVIAIGTYYLIIYKQSFFINKPIFGGYFEQQAGWLFFFVRIVVI